MLKKINLVILLLFISGCNFSPPKDGAFVYEVETQEIKQDSIISRIEGIIARKLKDTKKNASIAIKAFNYLPAVFNTCVDKKFDQYLKEGNRSSNVVVRECLFKSRLAVVAQRTIYNTDYAQHKIREEGHDGKDENVLDVLNSKNVFYLSLRTSIESAVSKVADFLKYDFKTVGQSSKSYQSYNFETNKNESILDFLSRIEGRFNKISISVNTEERSILLVFFDSIESIELFSKK